MLQVCLHPGLMYDDYEPESAAALVRASGKLALLHNILPKLQLAGHRFRNPLLKFPRILKQFWILFLKQSQKSSCLQFLRFKFLGGISGALFGFQC